MPAQTLPGLFGGPGSSIMQVLASAYIPMVPCKSAILNHPLSKPVLEMVQMAACYEEDC